MTLSESVLVALFIIMVVFGVLAMLFLIIKLFSIIIGVFVAEKRKPDSSDTNKETLATKTATQRKHEEYSSGTLKLKNVDEPTAAIIMAIVSDESGIPLSELCFKSIRLINKQSKHA